MSCSKVLPLRRHLSGRKTLPAMLKILSTGVEEAGMHKYLSAIFDIHPNSLSA